MSGTNIRVVDLPDMGTVTDAASFVADRSAATGRFSALALKSYCATTTLPEAPSTNTPYGRQNGAWVGVLGEAPSTGLPYARLNATWSAVVPEAPVTGSVYGRGSAGWIPVLPITGGTVNGNLGTTGTMTVGGALYGQGFQLSAANGYEWSFFVQAGTGNHIQQHRAGWYDAWLSAGGLRSWAAPSGDLMTLDGTGNLTLSGYAAATAFWAGAPGVFGFAPGGSGRVFQFRNSFYLDFSTIAGPTDATLQWVTAGGPLWVMRASDAFTFNPQSAVGGNGAYINSSDRRGKTGITPTSKGLAEVLQLQPVSFTRINAATGSQEEIGFVAQDVQPIVPEAVWTAGIPLRDGSGGLESAEPTLGLTESTITAILVNAVKELTARIVALEGAAA
jgi:hypothetical protein